MHEVLMVADNARVVEPAQELVLLPQDRLLLTPVDALHRHLRRGALLGHSFFQNSDRFSAARQNFRLDSNERVLSTSEYSE